jgi:hypothetical protein
VWEKLEAWGKAHPVALGLTVFGIGLLLLWWFGYFSSSSSSTSSGIAAYYAAETAAAAANSSAAQTGAAQEVADTQTAAQLQAYSLQAQVLTTSAADQVQVNQQNDLAAVAIAQIQGQTSQNLEATNLAATLGENLIAANPASFSVTEKALIGPQGVTFGTPNLATLATMGYNPAQITAIGNTIAGGKPNLAVPGGG